MSIKFNGSAYELGSFEDKLSEDADVIIGVWTVICFKTKVFTFTATDNNLLVDIQYSMDGGVTWTDKDTDVSVTTATPVEKSYTDPYTQMRVKVRAAGAGSQGTLSTVFFGTQF